MDQSTFSRRTILHTTSVVLSGVALAGCAGNESSGSPAGGDGPDTTTEQPPTETEKTEVTTDEQAETTLADDEWVSIVSHEWKQWSEYSEGVEVVVQNNRDVALDIFVTARFFDSDGVQIGDSMRHSSGVSPDAKAKQKLAWTGDSEPASYKLTWEAYES